MNRPGGPPFQPFQLEEMTKAQAFAGVEAVLLRYWERTSELARLAAHDLAAVLGTTAPAARGPARTWTRAATPTLGPKWSGTRRGWPRRTAPSASSSSPS